MLLYAPPHLFTNPCLEGGRNWQDPTLPQPPASKGPFSLRPKVLQEPAVETSNCARASAAPWRVCVSVCPRGTGSRLSRRHSLGFLRTGSSKAWAFSCCQLGLWRPPGQSSRPGCAGACTPMPFSFGVVSLTSQPSVAAHMVWWGLRERRETPGPASPSSWVFWGKEEAGNCS